MSAILGFLVNNSTVVLSIFGIAGFGGLLNIILKKFITKKTLNWLGNGVGACGFGLGVFFTVGLSKWRYTKAVWNKIIEPYVIVFLELIVQKFFGGLIRGLESDNQSLNDD